MSQLYNIYRDESCYLGEEIKLNMKIENLIKSGESETVEFKQGFSREAIETAAALKVIKAGNILKNKGQFGHNSDILIASRNPI